MSQKLTNLLARQRAIAAEIAAEKAALAKAAAASAAAERKRRADAIVKAVLAAGVGNLPPVEIAAALAALSERERQK